MKYALLILTTCLFIALQTASAQSSTEGCPPGAWCHPDGAGLGHMNILDGMTGAADAAGKDMNSHAAKSGCSKGSWNPSCIFAATLPCLYPSGSPQAEMCGVYPADGNPDEDKPDEKEETQALRPQLVSMDGKIWSGKRLFEYYSGAKRGSILHRYKNGGTLKLEGKYQDQKSDGLRFYLVLGLYNKSRKLVARPTIYYSDARTGKGKTKLWLAERYRNT